jgi:hypothetical protein
MKDFDQLNWPPGRSDLVMLVGLALIAYASVEKAWGVVVVGAALILAGLLAPRMKGPFLFGNPTSFQFRGELVDPGDSPNEFRGQLVEPTATEPQRPPQSALPERAQPQAPPESSQPPVQ